MLYIEGKETNAFGESIKTYTTNFENIGKTHSMVIKEYENSLFCVFLDGVDTCCFDDFDAAKGYCLGLSRGFLYCKDDIFAAINNLNK